MDWIDKAAKAREKLMSEQPELFRKIVEILFRHDPVHINYETNDNEYEPEAGTIISRLEKCTNPDDVRKAVYEEFIRWFYDDVGDESEYEELAKEIWGVWIAHHPEAE